MLDALRGFIPFLTMIVFMLMILTSWNENFIILLGIIAFIVIPIIWVLTFYATIQEDKAIKARKEKKSISMSIKKYGTDITVGWKDKIVWKEPCEEKSC